MAPKELTEEEHELVQSQLDRVYRHDFVVPTDAMLNNHKNSYDKSTDDAILTFNEYMHKFLTLNRDLRTDSNGITELLDNVPSVFALPEANTECYFAFTVNFDLNPRGTIRVFFESKKRVRVFISDKYKKPQAANAEKIFEQSAEPHKFVPFRQYQKDIFQGQNQFDEMAKRPALYNKKGQIIDKQVWITVKADEGPAHGRIHIKTDVTMAQLQDNYNEFAQ